MILETLIALSYVISFSQEKSEEHSKFTASVEIEEVEPVQNVNVDEVVQLSSDLISSFEGFRSCPYPDAGGYSIGYGSYATVSSVCISETQAMAIVKKESLRLYKQIERYYRVQSFTESQLAAMISFSYNTPHSKPIFNNPYCVQGFTEKNMYEVDRCFDDYAWLSGLRKRRDAEFNLFFKDKIL